MVASGSSTRAASALLMQGRLVEARVAFWNQVDEADAAGDAGLLAEAAIGLGGLWVHEHRSTLDRARVLALQERALRALNRDDPLACRLRARLAAERSYLGGDRDTVLEEVANARACGDPVALAEALSIAHHCLLGPAHGPERLVLADELIATAPLTDRPADALMGLVWRTIDLYLLGDRRAARSRRELLERLAVDRCDAVLFVARAIDVMVAMREGDLTGAERMAEECFAAGAAAGDADAPAWYGAQLLAIRWLQGRSAEMLDLVRDLDQAPTVPEHNDAFAAATASVAAAAGQLDLARHALAGLRARGLGTAASPSCWLAMLTAVADAARAVGDGDIAAEVYTLLAPHADLPVMASLAVACFGSAHLPLGITALTCGDVDLAIGHFEAAVQANLCLGNRPCHAIAVAELAAALERRGDVARAGDLWAMAIDEAARLGMVERARQWRAGGDDGAGCGRDGEMWTVRLGGRQVTVAHCVGMEYLAALIGQDGREVAAVELTGGVAERGARQAVFDDAAKAAYRRRVEDLRAEIDDADVCNDIERAARAREELDVLLDELRRAAGLGGRTRSFAHDAERARVSVRKAITRALATVRAADPILADELASRLVTGTRCSFTTTPVAAVA